MKPFYTNEMLVLMNYEEAARLRVAVEHMMWMNNEPEFKDEYAKWKTLYEDLTHVLEKIPF